MIDSFVSSVPAFAFVALAIVIVAGILICYALRIKGDVFAEHRWGFCESRQTTWVTRRFFSGESGCCPCGQDHIITGTYLRHN
jgi:hypothetical protein